MSATNRRPQHIVEDLVAKAAEVSTLQPIEVMTRDQRVAGAVARSACYQVLREAGWTLYEIGHAFARDHSTVKNQENKSLKREREDADHAFLLAELRRVLRAATRPDGFATIEARTRAQLWALEQEIAAGTALVDEIVSGISRAQRLHARLTAVLADIDAEHVITRSPLSKGQLQEVSA